MKILRYQDSQGNIRHGALMPDGSAQRLEGDLFASPQPTGEPADVAKTLAPLAPSQILCIGLNYRRHAEETGAKLPEFPVLFVKGPNTAQNPEEPIYLPRSLRSDKVDYECELAVVIGKECKNVSRENALDFVLGYTCANDVSARDWQIERGGGQWCRGKFFDTFCPLGPVIATPDELSSPSGLRIATRLNGETVQDSSTADMIFDVPALIEFLSGSCTLVPGTVILTGTPEGVGMGRKPQLWLKPGDEVVIEIEGIGSLRNPVAEETV